MSITDNLKTDRKIRLALWVTLAVIGIALWSYYAGSDDGLRAWRALLANFIYFTPLTAGLVVWPAVVRSCNGKWHVGLERIGALGMGFALPSVVVLVVLWIGSRVWTPWYGKSFHQGTWLANNFVFGRNLFCLLVFWGLAWTYLWARQEGRGRVLGPILIVVYALVFSLTGMDLVMALDPEWYSTLAGGYFFITGFYIALLCWTFIAVWKEKTTSDQRYDLGRLVLAFSLMSTYLMYAHLLPIWYEVLPEEVRFLVPRMNFKPWSTVSLVLVGTVYLGPLVLLLMERAKRSRWYLGAVSLMLLGGMWVERWWLVAPTFSRGMIFGLIEISVVIGMVGLFALGAELLDGWLPRDFPAEQRGGPSA